MAAFLGPLIAGIAKAGAGLFARAGAKSVAAAATRAGAATAAAARGAAGAVGRVSAGQTVLEGGSWNNANLFTKALDLAKKGGGTVRQVISQGRETAAAAARPGGAKKPVGVGSPASRAMREGKEALSGESRKNVADYLKGLRKGSVSDRHKRLTEAGQMLPMHEVPKRPGEMHPSKKSMVRHSEAALVRAKQKELGRQEDETRKKTQLATQLTRATQSLIIGPASAGALGMALYALKRKVSEATAGFAEYSMVIAGEKRLNVLSEMIRGLKTARGTERTFAFKSQQYRELADAMRPLVELLTNILNVTMGLGAGYVNMMIRALEWKFGTQLKALRIIAERVGLLVDKDAEGQMLQQGFRDYWNAMSAGEWNRDIVPRTPGEPQPPTPGGPHGPSQSSW